MTEQSLSYPIDRVLFETTEFCVNNCSFCYGDYGPEGLHMSPECFAFYLRNLLEGDLLDPESLLILFGGEALNHPRFLDICQAAIQLKKPTMNLVLITSGKFLDEFKEQVDVLLTEEDFFHHWEISIKDTDSFRFGTRILEKEHRALFRYDYLDTASLKRCVDRFFRHVKTMGIWKEFQRLNAGLEKRLRQICKGAGPDTVIIEEFYFPHGGKQHLSTGLVFSPLDRCVLRGRKEKSRAQCSLFNYQYQRAVHVTRDGTLYPCHLPRFRKMCEPLGNVQDKDFVQHYPGRLQSFRNRVGALHKKGGSTRGLCVNGCRGKLDI